VLPDPGHHVWEHQRSAEPRDRDAQAAPRIPRALRSEHAPRHRLPGEGAESGGGRRVSEVATSPISVPPEPLLDPRKTFADVNDDVSSPLERKPGLLWKVFFGISLLLTIQFAAEISYQIYKGIGIWGLNHPVGWAVDITSFVF